MSIFTIVGVAALIAPSSPAFADGGAGSGTTGPLGHGVTGAGAWYNGGGGNQNTVPFECNAIATGPAGFTAVRPPEQGGCVLLRNGVQVAGAPGVGVPATAAATSAVGSIQFLGTLSLVTCWKVYAAYNNGDLMENDNCSTLTII